MVRLENVTKIFPDTQTVALKEFNFYMKPGEFCFLKGESGCGKTTLLRLLLREILPDTGTVMVNGKNLAQMKRKQIPYYRRSIGFVFQDYKLIGDMNVYQNVALTRFMTGMSEKETAIQAAHALRMVGMEDYFDRYPNELSGGERQRAAIARAIIGNPMLVLADEPTGNLDPANAHSVMELLRMLHDRLGITMLIATHDEEATDGIDGMVLRMP